MDTSKIKDRAEAQFLVEVEDCKDLQLISNEEMVYFYKDILIDYYQGIHFSWLRVECEDGHLIGWWMIEFIVSTKIHGDSF